jgi:hypothetical protein
MFIVTVGYTAEVGTVDNVLFVGYQAVRPWSMAFRMEAENHP